MLDFRYGCRDCGAGLKVVVMVSLQTLGEFCEVHIRSATMTAHSGLIQR